MFCQFLVYLQCWDSANIIAPLNIARVSTWCAGHCSTAALQCVTRASVCRCRHQVWGWHIRTSLPSPAHHPTPAPTQPWQSSGNGRYAFNDRNKALAKRTCESEYQRKSSRHCADNWNNDMFIKYAVWVTSTRAVWRTANISIAIYDCTQSHQWPGSTYSLEMSTWLREICEVPLTALILAVPTSVTTDSTKAPWLQRSRLSRPMNQSGEGTSFVITDTCNIVYR